jgi:hypothetical protein
MLRCAASFVIAAYAKKVRLIPQDWRALPLELFTKPSQSDDFTEFLRESLLDRVENWTFRFDCGSLPSVESNPIMGEQPTPMAMP